MAENSNDTQSTDSFSPSFAEGPSQFEGKAPPEAPPENGPGALFFARTVARQWVEQHQKASMLGAFAAGVFIGALLRK